MRYGTKYVRAPRNGRTSENSFKANFRESPECELRGDGVLRNSVGTRPDVFATVTVLLVLRPLRLLYLLTYSVT